MAQQGKKSPVDLARYLSGIDFPANRDDLLEHARGQAADDEVLSTLQHLPQRDYKNMAEVMKGFGQAR